MRIISAVCLLLLGAVSLWALPTEEDYYRIVDIPIPETLVVEPCGVELLPDDRLAVCTRRGYVYLIDGAYGEPPLEEVTFTEFADGLHEPLSISLVGESLFVTQRGEVTELRDMDNDDRADIFRTHGDGWELSGDYHEYVFGSPPDEEGNIWVVLCLTGSSSSRVKFRGWCLKITPEGETIPVASGIRSPGGIGMNAEGDMFYTDNQGPWNGSSSLKHLKPGSFQGNPNANRWYDEAPNMGDRPTDPRSGSRIEIERERIPQLVPPAVVFPHGKMGQSPTGIVTDTSEGKFGPFAGQVFVGDQTFSDIQRVFLEEVNGVYQGAAFSFKRGFASGNVGLRMDPRGHLFVGGSDRGWGARGGKRFALQRLDWTGEVPFEIHEMRAMPDGFMLTFTKPVDPRTAAAPESYAMDAYTYIYRSEYGSPVVDQFTPEIKEALVSPDGKSVRLIIDGLVKGHVHELRASGLRSAEDLPLLHDIVYYTLNEIPSRQR